MELRNETKQKITSDDMKRKIEERIAQIEEEIGSEISEKYAEEVSDTLKKLGGERQLLNGSGRKQMWKMLKRSFPKILQQSLLVKKIEEEI